MAKHTFTWLKVMLVVFVLYFIIYLFNHGIKSGDDLSTFFVLTIIFLTPGLILGYIINLFVNFRKAALCYSIGHCVVFAVMMYFFFIENKNQDGNLAYENKHDWNAEFPKMADLNKGHLDCIQKLINTKSNGRDFIVFMILVQDKNDSVIACFSQNKPNEVIYTYKYITHSDDSYTKYSVFFAFADNTDKVLYSEYIFRFQKYKIVFENELISKSKSLHAIRKKIKLGNKQFEIVDSLSKIPLD